MRGGKGNYYLMGIEFQFCKAKGVLETGCTSHSVLLNYTCKNGYDNKFYALYVLPQLNNNTPFQSSVISVQVF